MVVPQPKPQAKAKAKTPAKPRTPVVSGVPKEEEEEELELAPEDLEFFDEHAHLASFLGGSVTGGKRKTTCHEEE
jgi:hypothetical protein